MHPVLFHLLGFPVEAAGTLYLIAAILAGLYSARICRGLGGNPDDVVPGVFLTVVAAYVGARLHGVIVGGGLSYFGGLMLGALTGIGYLRWKRYPVGAVLDRLAPLAPILYALFRLGCFLNGDDYGPPTGLPWGMRFPLGHPPTSTRVHPTQLYEILLMVPVFLWIRRRRKAGLPAGTLMAELCSLLGMERFLVEFWRLGPRGLAGLSVGQGLALLMIVVGAGGRALVSTHASRVMTARQPSIVRSEKLHV